MLGALLQSRGPQCKRKDVMWSLVTPRSLKLADLPQGLADSWDAFLAYVSEASSASGMCSDGVHASVVLVGHVGAGKTTLAARLATGLFCHDTTRTVGVVTCELGVGHGLCVACVSARH